MAIGASRDALRAAFSSATTPDALFILLYAAQGLGFLATGTGFVK